MNPKPSHRRVNLNLTLNPTVNLNDPLNPPPVPPVGVWYHDPDLMPL